MGRPVKTPAEWVVEDVYQSPTDTIVRLALTGSYERDEDWPEVGQVLTVKPKEAA